jgi:ElaB/YqjD/DUF883 family membrane-anchored ribosome-binding protein
MGTVKPGFALQGLSLSPSPPCRPRREPEMIMPANVLKTAAKDAEALKDAATTAAKDAEHSFIEAAAAAKSSLAEAAKRVEKSVAEGLETLRAQSRTYTDTAGQQIDDAQRYVSERVRERPLTATLAGLGVGVLLGLLIAGNRNNNR